MNKKGFFATIILLIILAIAGFFWYTFSVNTQNRLKENTSLKNTIENKLEDYMKNSCVPTTCCHSTSCIDVSKAPDCSDILCTMSCEPETMDCGQGNCKWNNGKCEVEWNE